MCELDGDGADVAVVPIHMKEVCRVRREMPCALHSRQDLASLCLPALSKDKPRSVGI